MGIPKGGTSCCGNGDGFGRLYYALRYVCFSFNLWNGEKLESFVPEKGLRQGDPLSPISFVLCLEVLRRQILDSVEHKKWKPVKIAGRGPSLSHLFFVDDLFFFGEAYETQARIMESVLGKFCAIFSQKINVGKSKLYVSRNTNRVVGMAISSKSEISLTAYLGKYLGFLLSIAE